MSDMDTQRPVEIRAAEAAIEDHEYKLCTKCSEVKHRFEFGGAYCRPCKRLWSKTRPGNVRALHTCPRVKPGGIYRQYGSSDCAACTSQYKEDVNA